MGTLYVSDLDGTLLGADGRLSAYSRRGLVELLDRGVVFTVASARSVISMRGALGDLPLRLPVICFNGGFVSDYASGRHLHVFAIDDAAARGIYEHALAMGLAPMVSTHTPGGDRMYVPSPHNAGVAMYVQDRIAHADPRLRLVRDPAQGLDATVTCITVIAERSRLESAAATLPIGLADAVQMHVLDDLYTTGFAWLTVHGRRATKEQAIQTVLEDAGLTNHRVVAFGDQLNDLSMLARADHAVAPSNAVQAILDQADEVIGPHTDDAVVRWLLDNTA